MQGNVQSLNTLEKEQPWKLSAIIPTEEMGK